MPQLHLRLGREIDRLIVNIDDLAIEPDARERIAEGPDQPARERADERVIEIALAPLADIPFFLEQEHRIQPLALRRQHGSDVFDGCLKFFQILLVIGLHFRGNGLLRFAIAARPVQLDIAAVDTQLGDELAVAEFLAAQADFFQPRAAQRALN